MRQPEPGHEHCGRVEDLRVADLHEQERHDAQVHAHGHDDRHLRHQPGGEPPAVFAADSAWSSTARITPAYQRFIGAMCRVKPSTLNNSMNQTGAGSGHRRVAVSISILGSHHLSPRSPLLDWRKHSLSGSRRGAMPSDTRSKARPLPACPTRAASRSEPGGGRGPASESYRASILAPAARRPNSPARRRGNRCNDIER